MGKMDDPKSIDEAKRRRVLSSRLIAVETVMTLHRSPVIEL